MSISLRLRWFRVWATPLPLSECLPLSPLPLESTQLPWLGGRALGGAHGYSWGAPRQHPSSGLHRPPRALSCCAASLYNKLASRGDIFDKLCCNSQQLLYHPQEVGETWSQDPAQPSPGQTLVRGGHPQMQGIKKANSVLCAGVSSPHALLLAQHMPGCSLCPDSGSRAVGSWFFWLSCRAEWVPAWLLGLVPRSPVLPKSAGSCMLKLLELQTLFLPKQPPTTLSAPPKYPAVSRVPW